MTQHAEPLHFGGLEIVSTQSCFDDAMEFFEVTMPPAEAVRVADTFRIVHGVCLGADAGEPFAHAWVEQAAGEPFPDYIVWQAGLIGERRVYYATDRDWFYDTWRVAQASVYTLREVVILNFTTGHYGPWEPFHIELCNRGDGRILGVVQGAAPLAFFFPEPAAEGEPLGLYMVAPGGGWPEVLQ